MKAKNILNILTSGLLAVGAVSLPMSSSAAPGTVATQPLFTQNAVNPNILLSIDDSGSMDGEVLMQSNDGALWWNVAEKTFVGWLGQAGSASNKGTATPGLPNYNINGAANDYWKKYVYLFPNGTGTGNRVYSDSTNDHYAIPPLPQYAFMRSPDYNGAYYNPGVAYEPWISYTNGGTAVDFNDIPEAAAPSDPVRGSFTFDLTDTTTDSSASNRTFKMYDGMVIPTGTYYNDGTWKTAASDVAITSTQDIGIRYNPAVYYRKSATGTYTITDNSAVTVAGDCSTPDTNHYRYFEKRPSSLTTVSGTVDALGPDGACLVATTLTAGSTEMQKFANWFSYYRKRHLAMRAGVSRAFENITGVYTGLFTINNRVNVTMLDFDTERDTFYNTLYGFVGSGGTPNRQALNHAGLQYKRTGSGAPVIAECQKNFTIFFTDGFASLGGTLPSPGNTDGDNGSPYADTYSSTFADIAMKYYEENLDGTRPTGKVPVSNQCNDTPVDPKLDCNENLHMVTYTVGLGAQGTIFNNTVAGNFYDEVADVYANPVVWPDTNSARDPTQIDDLYHAAVNGRGEMLNAATPAELETAMKSALTSITEQTGSAASVAFNTSVLSTGAVVYQARFNTDKWKGELKAFALDPVSGAVAASETWDAGDVIPSPNARNIITYNPETNIGAGPETGKGVTFSAGTMSDLSDSPLSSVAIADLGVSLPGSLTQLDRLNYLRGDRTYEDTGEFRKRHPDTVLGDIVHSAPVFVGNPVKGTWPDGDGFNGFPQAANVYSTFANSTTRAGMIYAGANDGMLHVFDATSGVEQLAYIPHELYSSSASKGLHYLSDTGYTHAYYVDGTPSIADVYTKGRTNTGQLSTIGWRTVLVGTLRGGGNGVFAMDITDPSGYAETADAAASTILWEFTDADDADLGQTFSRPIIVPTHATDGSGNLRWAAIFGNGYNNTGSCTASLFIAFLDGGLDGAWTLGTDYIKLDTGVGDAGDCNGLSSPRVVDVDGDSIADGVYAGDMYGNMWSFDLCARPTSGPVADRVCQGSGWDIAYKSGSTALPLFTANDATGNRQPITSTPTVISHPTILSGPAPNTLVLFGTGQYLVDGDKDTAGPPSHSFYGVWDRGDDSLLRADLFQQTFEAGFGVGADTRVTTTGEPDYSGASPADLGWYLDLPDTSDPANAATGAPERVVVSSVVLGDIIFFNTLVPTANGCDVGGYGYLMSVLTKSGGRPDRAVFDVNGDGLVNGDDLVTVSGSDAAAVGKKSDEGILSEPSFLSDQRYESTSKGKILVDKTDPTGTRDTGRYSWQEVRDE